MMTKRKKFKHDYGLEHVYKFYKEKYTNPVVYKQFTQIINLFNVKLIESIYRGAYVTLPYTLGDMYIYKYKYKYKFDENGNPLTKGVRGLIDYKATNELWKEHPELKHIQRVLYDNFHTDGLKCRIKWKRYHTLRAHKLYNFEPSRAFRRGLAKFTKEFPNQNYYGS